MRTGLGRWRLAGVIAAALAAAVFGCNAILGFSDYAVADDAGTQDVATQGDAPVVGDAGADGCIDPTGFGGRGCYKCTPETNEQFLSACTEARFEPFDNAARIAGFDPQNPKPALVDGGPSRDPFDAGAPVDAGPTDAGTPDLCPLMTKPNPVLLLGATGFPLDVIQRAMGSAATIFYRETASCLGIDSVITGSTKLTGAIDYYDEDGTRRRCNLAQDLPADIGLSGLFAETCTAPAFPTVPPDVQDFLGPVNPVMYAVPATSNQRVISAEAAYRVYGLAPSGVSPWDDEEFIFRRTNTSANQNTVALTLGLSPDVFRGRDSKGSSNMLKALQTSANPEKTIGISSSEVVDINRPSMKALAYQHYGQPVGFFPDSIASSFDRRNVRDGHYYMWIPLHVFARTELGEIRGASGQPFTRSADAVKKVTLVMTSRSSAPNPSVDLFGALGALGNVPQCAMHVTRLKEGAPLRRFTPAIACDCAFEAAVPNGSPPAGCQRCGGGSTQCPTEHPTCSFGFCE
jgi:hypothetical protein